MIFLIIMSIFGSVNELDSLKTSQDVAGFIRKHVKDFQTFEVWEEGFYQKPTERPLIGKLKPDFWKVADFDIDGKKELFVLGRVHGSRQVMLHVKKMNGHFEDHEILPLNLEATIFPEVKEDEYKQPLLILNTLNPAPREITEFKKGKVSQKLEKQILIYKYGGFVEYNSNDNEAEIQQLEFKTSRCFGSCPVFEMKIGRNGDITYNAMMYNEEEGTFSKELPTEEITPIFELAEYIDMNSLQEKFEVPWTDDQTITTTVTFNDNTQRVIKDYGLKGTYGLQQLYKLVLQLKNQTEW